MKLPAEIACIITTVCDDDDDDNELKFNDASTHGVILRLEGYTAL